MKRAPRRLCQLSPLLLFCSGCDQPVPDAGQKGSAQPDWSNQQEVIYQLQEVIKYEDDEERVRQENLRRLSLPVAPPES
jgi:hypothetical protein